jgi:L-fucose mutarotase
MLKGIPSILNADLLWVLRAMGHGDDLAIVDRNFPATTVASQTTTGKLITIDGANDPQAIAAIVELMPLDTFVPCALHHMQVVGEPDTVLDIHREVQMICSAAHGADVEMQSIERHAFYERAKQTFSVVQTSEDRPYGCFILKKGVVFD